MNDSRIIVALDFATPADAIEFSGRLDAARCRVKVGKELFTRAGPSVVETLVQNGFDVFLDLKFHDIPNTVAGACAAAADLGVWMVNVHASGGRRMMIAAREAIDDCSHQPLLVAVTVLTSLAEPDLAEIGFGGQARDNVRRLARLTRDAGLDGVVCSPLETAMLRAELGKGFCLVTPGIRPEGSQTGDQLRVTTPVEALRNGSDYLVIGRPVTRAKEPMTVLDEIDKSLQGETGFRE